MRDDHNMKALLSSCRLLVTAGSGGVGKTTLAAALAVRAAEMGRRVAVLTIDPAQRLAQSLGIESFTGSLRDIDLGPDCHGHLSAMMLDTKSTGDAMVNRFARDAESAQAILNNRYYRYFSTTLAGSLEYMAIEQVRVLIEESGFDLIVLDTPPASHALDFLDAPERLIDSLERIPLKMIAGSSGQGLMGRLAKQGRTIVLRGLNRLTGGPFLEDLAEFLGRFHGILDALKNAGRHVQRLLRDEGTKFLLVTTPTIGRIEEVIAFRRELRQRELPLGGFILNRVHEPLPNASNTPITISNLKGGVTDSALGGLTDDAWAELLTGTMVSLAEHNQLAQRDAEVCQRLAEAAERPPFTVSRLPFGVIDLEGLRRIADCVAPIEPGT